MALRSLMAVAEQYPQLKADALFLKLSMRISDIEDHIADKGEMYNESVTVFNVKLEQFPDIIIARGLGYGRGICGKLKPPTGRMWRSLYNHNKD